ncbi:MAG: hypothetical protein R3F07_14670 [Opitutaceae bacterium]
MTPHPIIIRRFERREGENLVHVEEAVHGEAIYRELRLDEPTFIRIQQAVSLHPFPKKSPDEDVVLFRGVETQLGDPKKYLNLQVVNSGSRHHLKIEASEEAFASFSVVIRSWTERFEKPNQPVQTRPTSRPV